MKSIYLVRHTEYSNPRNIFPGRLPVELSPIGIKHAEKLGAFFADKNITKIYSSAIKRCQQTSDIIAQTNNTSLPIENDQRILETMSAYQGYQFDSEEEIDWQLYFSHQPTLGGENLIDIQKRAFEFFLEVAKKDEGNIIICSHEDPLIGIYLGLTEQPTPDYTNPDEFEDELPYGQPKGSIREILWEDADNYDVEDVLELW